MDAHVQFKSAVGIAVWTKKMIIAANARNYDMSVGRAVSYALADPDWDICDGPPASPPPWLPSPGGARGGGGGGSRGLSPSPPPRTHHPSPDVE